MAPSLPLCYSQKMRNYRMREKKIICIYGCFNVSRYIKGGRKSRVCINNTHWQCSGKIIFLCNYIVISDTLRKKYIEEFVWRSSLFCCFLLLFLSPSQVIYLLNGPYKNSWYCYGCVMISWVNGQKYENLLQF